MSNIILYLSSIISLRFLGLFIVLPVISYYSSSLENSTPFLAGLSLGIYAISQLIFQVPFGILSDRVGRKKSIIFGLIIFLLGSIVCFLANDIYTLIVGRFLQGVGAIGSIVTAMISDFTTDEKRGKAMATMGISIAISFALSMFIAPVFKDYFEIKYLFLLTIVLILISLVILIKKVPEPSKAQAHFVDSSGIKSLLLDKNLFVMNITNLLQKSFMTATFFLIPIEFMSRFEGSKLMFVYLPALILGILAMAPSAIFAEKRGKFREVILVGIVLFALSYVILGFFDSKISFIVGVTIFFIAFNIHEPIMQSLTSKFAKVTQRGVALSIFSSFGYFGTFLGGIIGSFFVGKLTILAIIILVTSILWGILILKMQNPSIIKNLYLDNFDIQMVDSLKNLIGIVEVYTKDNQLVIKYNSQDVSEEKIRNFFR